MVVTGAVVGTTGCMGGEVVFSKNESVIVPPDDGAVFELPEAGDEIEYTARDVEPFTVYVFESERAIRAYRTYIKGGDPDERPTGIDSFGGQAIKLRDDLYELSTDDRAREPLNVDGNAYFVLDNSNYEDAVPASSDSLSIQVDLTVVSSTLPI